MRNSLEVVSYGILQEPKQIFFSNAQKKLLSMYVGLVIQVNEELCLPQTRLRAGCN